MKFLVFLVTLVICIRVMALPPIGDVEKSLNLGSNSPINQLGTQLVSNKIQMLKCYWSFARQGGAISTISLQSVDGADCKLPDNAIVVKVWIDTVTALTGASVPTEATVSVSTGKATADLWYGLTAGNYSGVMDTLAGWSAASAIKMTAVSTPSIEVTKSALTGGRINVFISYIISD
jgi:hypothetical protein